jgi:internalin A
VIRRQTGRFTSHLLAALVCQNYQPEEHKLFLSLMQQCQSCFAVAEDTYIAPALLPPEAEVCNSLDLAWRAESEAVGPSGSRRTGVANPAAFIRGVRRGH